MDIIYSILHEGKVQVGDTEGIDEKWTPSIWMTSLLAFLVSVLITTNRFPIGAGVLRLPSFLPHTFRRGSQ